MSLFRTPSPTYRSPRDSQATQPASSGVCGLLKSLISTPTPTYRSAPSDCPPKGAAIQAKTPPDAGTDAKTPPCSG